MCTVPSYTHIHMTLVKYNNIIYLIFIYCIYINNLLYDVNVNLFTSRNIICQEICHVFIRSTFRSGVLDRIRRLLLPLLLLMLLLLLSLVSWPNALFRTYRA